MVNFKLIKVRSLPALVVEIPDGIVVKRGWVELKIRGVGASEAVRTILSATQGESFSIKKICSLFLKSERQYVEDVIRTLLDRNILVADNGKEPKLPLQEDHHDIFWKQFGQTTERVVKRLVDLRLVIMGVNHISLQLAKSLIACGYSDFQVIDYPELRNPWLFNKTGGLIAGIWPEKMTQPIEWNKFQENSLQSFMIITSDCGGQEAIGRWNRFCIDRKLPFLPIILKNMVGIVGPLVFPEESPCYECYLGRQRSHLKDTETEKILDEATFQGRHVIGFHPAMARVLGEIGAFEITCLNSGAFAGKKIGRFIEVNLLGGEMTERIVLKLPRCIACSPLRYKTPINLSKWGNTKP